MSPARVLVIQRGHYPRTHGATGTGGLDGDPTEQEFAAACATAIAKRVGGMGWAVRTINADVPMNQYGGAAFVAIHCDGSSSRSAHGASVGYQTPEGASFATAFKHAYAASGWRGFRPDNYTRDLAGYYGVRRAVAMGNRKSIIVECGFLTNPDDEAVLQTGHGLDMVASAVAVALAAGPPAPPRPGAPPVIGGGATLRRGSTGDAVRQWQSILAGAGLLGPEGVDGKFGASTEAATKAFQRQLGVDADGVVGPDTRAATARLLAWLTATTGHQPQEPKFPGTVDFGDVGWAVQVWQRQLARHGYRVPISGRFDAVTQRAVTHWQRNHHPPLTVDGVAGPATWHSLLRA